MPARAPSAPRAWTKPARLRPGDTVAVVAPAGPVPHLRLTQGIATLERLGLHVRLGAGVLSQTRYLAGDDRTRALDLVSLWANPSVKAVFCARGGYGSARIVDVLTPAFLAKHPKIFCGFSDITTLHEACARARLVSFYGPMAAWDLAHGAHRAPKTRAGARRLIAGARVTTSGGFDEASLRAMLFGASKGYRMAPAGGEALVKGRATGRLLGGCLSLLAASLGTPGQLDTRGAILLLEDEMEPPYRMDRMLTQLRRAGMFDRVRGIVLGDFPECEPDRGAGYALVDVLRDRLGDLGVPVLWRFPFGHTARPNLTLPLGVRATLDATRGALTIDESVTR
jgi:muramoyltetrapeptide carboxypeptidase